MEYIKGMDARYWNGIMPPGYDFKFAGIKISQGTSHAGIDYTMPRRQWQLCPDQGIDRLPFHFWKGSVLKDPKEHGYEQADLFYQTTVSLNLGLGELPPVIDVESFPVTKGLRHIMNIFYCLERTKDLWGKEPLVYTARWAWDPNVVPYHNYNGGQFKPYRLYKLWESDPPPDTIEPGEWMKSDVVIQQVELDAQYPGFNAKIDINWADKKWYDSFTGITQPLPPAAEKAVVEVEVTQGEAEIIVV